MKCNKLINYYTLIVLILSTFSCSSRDVKDWEKLKNRKFHFKKFEISYKSGRKEEAYELMKKIPVVHIMQLLEDRYKIEIDSVDFQYFIFSGSRGDIKEKGLLSKDTYTWESSNKNRNIITLKYIIKLTDGGNPRHMYDLSLKIDEKKTGSYSGYIHEGDDELVAIAGRIGYDRDKESNGLIYISSSDGKRVKLIDVKASFKNMSNNYDRNKAEKEIKEKIEEHLKRLSETEKKVFRDGLMKFMYMKSE